jgi:hypothetical protein
MKKAMFPTKDLEDRADIVERTGNFLAVSKRNGATCALMEVYGDYVEVVCERGKRKKLGVKSIEFIEDQIDVIASYVPDKLLKEMVEELFSKDS